MGSTLRVERVRQGWRTTALQAKQDCVAQRAEPEPTGMYAFATSMSLTLQAASPCKSAILPICHGVSEQASPATRRRVTKRRFLGRVIIPIYNCAVICSAATR